MAKTPAIIRCERDGVAHTVHAYRHDPSETNYGLEAAEVLGISPERVFKTLIVNVDGQLVTAVVPVSGSLDLKALAAAVGGKRAEMADPRIAERKSGYIVGGISPIAQKTALPTVLDASATGFDTVFVSAGMRGADIELAPSDLVRLTNATLAPIGKSAH